MIHIFPVEFKSERGVTSSFTYDGRYDMDEGITLFQQPFELPKNVPLKP